MELLIRFSVDPHTGQRKVEFAERDVPGDAHDGDDRITWVGAQGAEAAKGSIRGIRSWVEKGIATSIAGKSGK